MAETKAKTANHKMLGYRAWHRGTRELDLLLGPFADAALGKFNEAELAAFTDLLEMPDTQLHELITNGGTIANPQQNALLKQLRTFHGLPA